MAAEVEDTHMPSSDAIFSCFQREVLWEALASHPDTRAHVADSGFRSTIEKLRQGEMDQQAMARDSMKDPRVMQALAALQGWGLSVTEEEIKHAESVGDMKKRDAVQVLAVATHALLPRAFFYGPLCGHASR